MYNYPPQWSNIDQGEGRALQLAGIPGKPPIIEPEVSGKVEFDSGLVDKVYNLALQAKDYFVAMEEFGISEEEKANLEAEVNRAVLGGLSREEVNLIKRNPEKFGSILEERGLFDSGR
jgi:hypothetical protein